MYYVGVDLGATNVRAIVGDASATFLGSARAPTPNGPTGEAITEAVIDVVADACEDAGVEQTSVSAAGVGAMGRLNHAAGTVDAPANLTDGIGPVPLVTPLSEALDTARVFLCKDTLAGAVGDRFFVHSHAANLVYLTISSGIGAGVITDGEMLFGRDGNAGEVGHVTIDSRGSLTCGCGRDGHWEAYCSGNNIPQLARSLCDRDSETALPVTDPDFTAKDVFEYAGTDAFADRVIERIAALNTIGVANVVHAYDPDVISIGGAVALNNPEEVVEPIRARLDDAVVVDAPEVALSALGEQTVVKGALVYARSRDGTGRSKR